MEESYDISEPGSLFGLVVREPDIWKAADSKTKLAIARDWDDIGMPYPDAEVFKRLSPVERVQLRGLLTSLTNHARANRESDMAALKAQLPQQQSGAAGNRKAMRSIEVERDDGGRTRRITKYAHHD